MNRRTISILTFIVLLIMIFLLAIFMGSQSSITQAQQEALQLVEVDYRVDNVNQFYWTTTDASYFSMDFSTDTGERYYAIIEQEGGDTVYYPEADIISEADALAITASEVENPDIMQARLGKYQGDPVWELTLKNDNGTISYYILDAQSGEWIQTISNI